MEVVNVGVADWRLQTITVGPLLMNAHLLWSAEAQEAVLVDPGDESDRLLAAVDATGCRLTHLLCTHGHFDHVSAAADVQSRWELPLQHHAGDTFLFERLQETRITYGFPPVADPVRTEIPDGPIPFAGGAIDVVHVPGHCPGHVMYVLGEHALVGDVIFRDSIGRTDFEGGDFDVLAASIRNHVYTMNDETVLHSGHGPITTVGYEKVSNPFVRQS